MRAINFPCMNDAKLGKNIQNCTENKSDEDCQSWIKFVEIVQLVNQTSVNLRANFAYLSTREAAFQIVTGIQIHQSQAELSRAWKALYSNANQQWLRQPSLFSLKMTTCHVPRMWWCDRSTRCLSGNKENFHYHWFHFFE